MSANDEHIVDELPRLLTGEADRTTTMNAATHLRGCEDCRQELVSAVVSHASLTSAQRFAPEVVARPAEEPELPAATPLPDLSGMFAQIRSETEAPRRSPTSRRWLIAAAAVVVGALVGGGAVALADHTGGSSGNSRSIALEPFGVGTTSASAKVSPAGTMQVNATSLPRLDSDQRYEVWLTNAPRTQMMPIGWVGDTGTAKLTVPSNLMQTYSDIEVSVQRVNAPSYTYSGTSVLRGSY
jgi:hypothetical protein